jgi:phage FluMu gp28-like protein
LQAVIEAATALLIWGGKIQVISTHNGKSNPYNQLVTDINTGRSDARCTEQRLTMP